ncbi:hypothetical protein ACED29_20925 [Shewanella sp. 5S214]|uniref:hypothetical protein n=1 Tax=Shewanella sp. 5S214 TaxID=3229999 RepID=UPI00352E400F
MSTDKPEPGSPEFDEWLANKAKKWSKELFSKDMPPELADLEGGLIAGPKKIEDIMPEKTIAEDIAIEKEEKRNLKRVK